MSRRLGIFILFSSFMSCQAMAAWVEKKCEDIFPKEKRNQTQVTNILSYKLAEGDGNKKWENIKYRVQAWYRPNSSSCSFLLRSKDNKRVYSFSNTGEFLYTNTITRKVTIFSNIPVNRQLKLFVDNQSGEVKIELPNNSEIIFNPTTGKIDPYKTSDFKVEETPFNELKLDSPEKPLISFIGANPNLNSLVMVHLKNKSCKMEASKLYDYTYTCQPIKVNQSYEFKECSATNKNIKVAIKKEKGEYTYQDINGVKLKKNYLEILAKEAKTSQCPLIPSSPLEAKPETKKSAVLASTQNCPQELINYFSKEFTKEELKHYLKDISGLAIMRMIQMARFVATYNENLILPQKNINSEIDKAFSSTSNNPHSSPLYLKILALQYQYNTIHKEQSTKPNIKLSLADLKILNILIRDSENDDQKFNKGIDQLLTMALNNIKTKAENERMYTHIENKINAAQKKAITYLISKDCHYEGQFFDCTVKNEDVSQEFIFEDSHKVIEFFYQNLIKLSLQ